MLSKAIERLKFDSRMISFHKNNGQFDEQGFQEHLKKLPDLANQVVKIKLGFDRKQENSSDL